MASATPPALILVVGMHRSGTSLLGDLLQSLGVTTPGPLIAGDRHNPGGYFERHDVSARQEQLLIDLGRWWPSATGDQPLPAGWLEHPATRATAAELRRLLAEEAGCQQGAWAIKDPRTSLLLPLWRRLAEELALPLRLVLAVRDPREVAVSLCHRDAGPTGMTAERAQRLWWHHNQQLLHDAADLPLQVIDYGRWFSSRAEALRQISQLQAACGLANDPDTARAALSRIRPEHRRSRARLPLLPGVARLHRRLQQLSRHPSAPPPSLQALCLPPPAQKLEAGSWFDPDHYRSQRPDLDSNTDLLHHYLNHGWRENEVLEPHPLFKPAHYRHVLRTQGIPCSGNPLEHFLLQGIALQLEPGPLVDPIWMASRGLSLSPHQPLRLARLHPWGAAAEALSNNDPAAARARLARWLSHGFSPEELQQLGAVSAWPTLPEPLSAPDAAPDPGANPLADLISRGATPLDWAWHAWKQHLPPGSDGLNLLDLAGAGPPCQQLLVLSHCRQVLDPDPQRVALLRRLGSAAQLLQPEPASAAAPAWLADPALLEQASAILGLPSPDGLAQMGDLLVLGSGGDTFDRLLSAPHLGLPGFDQLLIGEPDQALALAAWLQACQARGLQLLRLNPSPKELMQQGFAALLPAPAAEALTCQLFHDPLHPGAIAEELAWRRAGCPPPPAAITPEPEQRLLWSHDGPTPPQGAICISLYNYGHRIEAALASAAAQSLEPVELVVVDDHSSDHGVARVLAWLERHGRRFARVRLLQHQANAGLAAARNTAFTAAASPWCFVLDADNSLEPAALEHCLQLATTAAARTAVVFPLIDVLRSDGASSHAEGLISRVSWQRQHFLQGNVIDAMALVRRSAWQAVDGYTHIPGGWEDFDFWCKLIDAGWHGVLCPERLATYHRHASSMLQQHTDRHVRRVSRLLQARHPWLQLPMAQPDR